MSATPRKADFDIVVDSLVLMKIMKHHGEHLTPSIAGHILGLDVDNTLEVTNCFESPITAEEDGQDQEVTKYVENMLNNLKKVNGEENVVGWYQCAYFGTYLTESSVVKTLVAYQELIGKIVVIIYDPEQTAIGKFPFKALRISDSFMKKLRELQSANPSKTVDQALQSIKCADVIEEVPIRVRNSFLMEAFLCDWAAGSEQQDESIFEGLKLNNQQYLEKHVTLLTESLDDLQAEQNKMQTYEKNVKKMKQKGDTQEDRRDKVPSYVDSALLSAQVSNYCKQLEAHTSSAMSKMLLLKNSN